MEFTGNTALVQPFQDLLKELKKVYFENKQYVDHEDDIQPFTDITERAPPNVITKTKTDIKNAVVKCADQFKDRSNDRGRMKNSKKRYANQKMGLFIFVLVVAVIAIVVPIIMYVHYQKQWALGRYLIEQGLHLVLLGNGAAFLGKLIRLDRKYDVDHSIESTYHDKVANELANLTSDSDTSCSVSPVTTDAGADTCPASGGGGGEGGGGECPFMSGGDILEENVIDIADSFWRNRHKLDRYDVVDSLFDLKMDVMTLYEFVAAEYDDAADQSLVGQEEYILEQLDPLFSMNYYMAKAGYEAINTENPIKENDAKTCFEKCLTSDTCAYASYDDEGNCTTAKATSDPFTLSTSSISGVKTLLKSDFTMKHRCKEDDCTTINKYMEAFDSNGSDITLSPANLTGTELAQMYNQEPIRTLLVNRFANIYSKFGGTPVSFESYKDKLRSKIRDGWPALNQTFDALVAEGKFLYDLNKESASKSQRFIRFERFHEKLNGLTTEQAIRTLYTPITHISRTANYMATHDVNKHIIWMRYDYYVERFSHINVFVRVLFIALFGYFVYYTYISNGYWGEVKQMPEKILHGVIVVLALAVTAFVVVLIHGQYTKKAQTSQFNKEIVNKNGQQFNEHAQDLLQILKKDTIQRQANIEACIEGENNEEDEVNHMDLLLLACRKKPAIYNKPIHITDTYDVSELYSHIVGLIETYEKCNNIKLSAAVSPPFPLMDVVVYTILIVFVVASLIYLFVTYNVIDLFTKLMAGQAGCGIDSNGKGHQQTVTIVVIGVILVALLLLLILSILESSKQTLSGLQASRYAQDKRCCNT